MYQEKIPTVNLFIDIDILTFVDLPGEWGSLTASFMPRSGINEIVIVWAVLAQMLAAN